jgi:hypothetical protein
MSERYVGLNNLLGKTMTSVFNVDDQKLVFITTEGQVFKLYHDQDCCESVEIESIVGDLADLAGEPMLMAEESTSNEHPSDHKPSEYDESFTWTFYKFATRKGYVDVRWFGQSNGYYSESVTFAEVKDE